MKNIAAAIFLLLLHSCRCHKQTTLGEYAQALCKDKNHGYAVSVTLLTLENDVEKSCGGSLINMKWTITVAKCVQDLFNTLYEIKKKEKKKKENKKKSHVCVFGGFNEKMEIYQERRVSKFVSREVKFGSKMRSGVAVPRHALALVELEKPFEPSPFLRTVSISKNVKKKISCTYAETVSYISVTKTTSGSRSSSSSSKKYEIERICRSVKIVQNANCTCELVSVTTTEKPRQKPHPEPTLICGQKKVRNQNKLKKVIEAEEETQVEVKKSVNEMSSCVGAIGSPLICNGQLIGIENRCSRGGARSDSDTADSSFTGVDSYINFIAETIEGRSEQQAKAATPEPNKSRADILKGNDWKLNLVVAGGTVFFFVCFLK